MTISKSPTLISGTESGIGQPKAGAALNTSTTGSSTSMPIHTVRSRGCDPSSLSCSGSRYGTAAKTSEISSMIAGIINKAGNASAKRSGLPDAPQ